MAAGSSSKKSPLKYDEVEEELFADSEVVPTRSGGSWRIDLPDFLRGITRPKVTRGISVQLRSWMHLLTIPKLASLLRDVALSLIASRR